MEGDCGVSGCSSVNNVLLHDNKGGGGGRESWQGYSSVYVKEVWKVSRGRKCMTKKRKEKDI